MRHTKSDWQPSPMEKRKRRERSTRVLVTPLQWPATPRLRNGLPSTGNAKRQMCLRAENTTKSG